MATPKCIQFVEAVGKGRKGAKKKKGKRGSEQNHHCNSVKGSMEDTNLIGEEDGGSVEGRPEEEEAAQPEFVSSGVNLLLGVDMSPVSDLSGTGAIGDSVLQREASKLMAIQKSVGFSFEVDDSEVRAKLVVDELRDRAQKVEREQVNGDQ
jgi:hypothetical protein